MAKGLILLVGCEESWAMDVAKHLREAGYDVQTSSNPHTAGPPALGRARLIVYQVSPEVAVTGLESTYWGKTVLARNLVVTEARTQAVRERGFLGLIRADPGQPEDNATKILHLLEGQAEKART